MLLSIYSTLLHKLIQQLTKLRQLLSVSKMSSLEYCVNQCSPCIFTATYCKITVHCWQLQLPVFYCFLTGQFLTVYCLVCYRYDAEASLFHCCKSFFLSILDVQLLYLHKRMPKTKQISFLSVYVHLQWILLQCDEAPPEIFY